VTRQAGLFSAALTAFVIDSKQNLQVKPQDQMVYYLQQHSTILSQISQQLSSITPQIHVPSTPPPPFPKFKPSVSDIRINAFWFLALTCSLFAALLAILVQQWVRDYMHVFQRYSDPLKVARLRQYLHEGSEGWFMPRLAEAVPGLLHFSLFLFFAGLGDTLLGINTTIGLSTAIPIGIGGLLYICTIFAPIIYPQSPYQNSFSGVIWHLFQKLRWRKYKDRGSDGALKHVSENMARGQMQLAMEETEERKGRDEHAIRWLIDNLTEDAEMERFMMAIPGSFSTNWGVDVWKKISDTAGGKSENGGQNEATAPVVRSASILTPIIRVVKKITLHNLLSNIMARQPVQHSSNPRSATPHNEGEDVVHELSTRVARSLEDCKNGALFAKEEWHRRTRSCIETTASLVCCANANFTWFGDIGKLLGDIAVSLEPRKLSLEGTDQFFVMHWTCLSPAAIREFLSKDRNARFFMHKAVESFAAVAGEDDTGDDAARALTGAQKIDTTLHDARERLYDLYDALPPRTEYLTKEEKDVIRNHLSVLEDINTESDHLENLDHWIFRTQSSIAPEITFQIPGVLDNLDISPVHFSRIVELSRNPRKIQFIRPGKALESICSLVPALRAILEGQGDADEYEEILTSLGELHFRMNSWEENEIQRQLWRLQDLHHGRGFGFTVELFFLALSQLLSISSSKDSHSALYTGALRTFTSDWSKHTGKNALGTQRLLLDIAMSRRLEFQDEYPDDIVSAFLELLGNIFKGQKGPHIDEAILQLMSPVPNPKLFQTRLLQVLAPTQPS
jgi:hypothetical protein